MAAKHAWYSEQATNFGTFMYRRAEDGCVEVTAVSDNEDYPEYKWPDKQYLGVVERFLCPGRPSQSDQLFREMRP